MAGQGLADQCQVAFNLQLLREICKPLQSQGLPPLFPGAAR